MARAVFFGFCERTNMITSQLDQVTAALACEQQDHAESLAMYRRARDRADLLKAALGLLDTVGLRQQLIVEHARSRHAEKGGCFSPNQTPCATQQCYCASQVVTEVDAMLGIIRHAVNNRLLNKEPTNEH